MEAQQTIPCMKNEPPHISLHNANSDASCDEDSFAFGTKQENSECVASTDSKEVYLQACLAMAASPVSQVLHPCLMPSAIDLAALDSSQFRSI